RLIGVDHRLAARRGRAASGCRVRQQKQDEQGRCQRKGEPTASSHGRASKQGKLQSTFPFASIDPATGRVIPSRSTLETGNRRKPRLATLHQRAEGAGQTLRKKKGTPLFSHAVLAEKRQRLPHGRLHRRKMV